MNNESTPWSQIDAICDEFESTWRIDERPQISDFLIRVDEQHQQVLGTELLLIEIQRLQQAGRNPSESEYQSLPQAIIAEAFGKVSRTSEAEPWVLDALSSCHSLHGLRGDCLDDMASRLQLVEFPEGEFLLREGQAATGLHILLSGVVEIRVGDESRLIDQSSKGAIVGEMSLLTGAGCTADVVATEPVRSLMLEASDYKMLCAAHEEFEVVMGVLVADRLGSRDWDALCGKEVNGFQIHGCLRRGGMGVVYEAAHPDQNGPVALKMLRHSLIHDEAAVQRFMQEGDFMESLRHENIVAVHQIFVAFRTVFMAMELCDGDDLGAIVSRYQQPMPEDIVRKVLGQLAAGLQYAQSKRIIHLDLKPTNVLIGRDGVAKLCDFGLSKALDENTPEAAALAGTPRYMSPEQLSAMEVGPESDWYGFGCLAYEMLAGKPLFDDASLMELSSIKANWVPPAKWPFPVSDELNRLLQSTLQPLPEHRELDLRAVGEWGSPVPEFVGGLL